MKICYRIAQRDWLKDESFEALYRSIEKWKNNIDELALFTGLAHLGHYPVAFARKCAPILKRRIIALKEMGIPSVGVNMWSTLGHVDESWDWVEAPPFQTVVGHDGKTSLGCLCMRNEGVLDYIREIYSIVATAQPDFVWLDDDVRMQHHMVEFPCFCHGCIQKFNRRTGRVLNRERLVKALEAPEQWKLRREFLEFNRQAMLDVCKAAEEGVHSVNPAIRTGIMTTDMAWNSYALSDQEGMLQAAKAEMVRPGGGFYNDETPTLLFHKLHSVSLQSAYAPGIPDNQYELEDFPICRNKSVHIHMIELTGALMAGCNGLALNSVIPNETEALMTAMERIRPMWNRLVKANAGTELRGFCPVYVPQCDGAEFAVHSVFSHVSSENLSNETAPMRMGMAFTPLPENAEVCTICGDMMAAISDEEIPRLFSKGVLMDAEALEILIRRGYGDLAGCRPGTPYHDGLLERYTPHSINGAMAGKERDVFMTFWDREGITVKTLIPQEGAEVLTELFSITGQNVGAGATFFRNHIGGRVAVLSYFAWKHQNTLGKAETVPCLMDALADGRFPVKIDGGTHVQAMLRTGNSGFTLFLTNTSFDATRELHVHIRARCRKATLYDTYGQELPCASEMDEQGNALLRLPALAGWGAYTVIAE